MTQFLYLWLFFGLHVAQASIFIEDFVDILPETTVNLVTLSLQSGLQVFAVLLPSGGLWLTSAHSFDRETIQLYTLQCLSLFGLCFGLLAFIKFCDRVFASAHSGDSTGIGVVLTRDSPDCYTVLSLPEVKGRVFGSRRFWGDAGRWGLDGLIWFCVEAGSIRFPWGLWVSPDEFLVGIPLPCFRE